MRLNKFLAQATGLSRRAADSAIQAGRVTVNQQPADLGVQLGDNDVVTLDGRPVKPAGHSLTIILNKPTGYVCSRAGQGSRTIYELLPTGYRQLKPVGRLDKDSSGLLLLTNDGDLANQLTHPRYGKTKIYEIALGQPLTPQHQQVISSQGVQLDDGPSRLMLAKLDTAGIKWRVTMSEGRNRQIRRSFAALGYSVDSLHRVGFGDYVLASLRPGQFQELANPANQSQTAV